MSGLVGIIGVGAISFLAGGYTFSPDFRAKVKKLMAGRSRVKHQESKPWTQKVEDDEEPKGKARYRPARKASPQETRQRIRRKAARLAQKPRSKPFIALE